MKKRIITIKKKTKLRGYQIDILESLKRLESCDNIISITTSKTTKNIKIPLKSILRP